MSWHYSQEQEEDFSLATYLDGIRSERSRSSSIPAMYCSNDSGTESSTHSQSGTMYEPSTASRGEDLSMLFRGDFPVKTSAWQEPEWALPETVLACGSSICESLTRFGLSMSLPKTHRCCVLVDSAPSSKDLPAWGMVFDGACWELGTSARPTSEIECGYWPTPTVVQRPNEGNMRLVRARAVAGKISWEEAEAMVGKYVRLPHGKLKGYWPTPQASDNRDRGHVGMPAVVRRQNKGKQLGLSMVVSDKSGKLNPPWVEWLMGWPIGWTDSKPLAMDKFQQWRQQHGKY